MSQEDELPVFFVPNGTVGRIPPRFSGSPTCFCVVSAAWSVLGLGSLVQAVVQSATPNAKDERSFLEG